MASATYDAANQIVTWGGASFTYDDNGNLTNDGARMLTWNPRNQLTALSGGAVAAFAYDGTGRRRSRTVDSATTAFLYDGQNLVQEQTAGGDTQVLAGLAMDEWLTRTNGDATQTYLGDHLGSIVGLVDDEGLVAPEYTYEPFGAHAVQGGDTNVFTFTGRENDRTGLYYYRARYYSAMPQRFISEDPLGLRRGGTTLYEYAGSNPVVFLDPCGLEKKRRCQAIAAEVARAYATCLGVTSAIFGTVIEGVLFSACAFSGPTGFVPCVLAMHHAIWPVVLTTVPYNAFLTCTAYAYWRYQSSGCNP